MSEHPRSVTTLPTPLPAPDSGVQPPPYVTVVLPAYNEQDHVLAEIERICGALDWRSDVTAGPAPPAGSAPSRRAARSSSGPTPT